MISSSEPKTRLSFHPCLSLSARVPPYPLHQQTHQCHPIQPHTHNPRSPPSTPPRKKNEQQAPHNRRPLGLAPNRHPSPRPPRRRRPLPSLQRILRHPDDDLVLAHLLLALHPAVPDQRREMPHVPRGRSGGAVAAERDGAGVGGGVPRREDVAFGVGAGEGEGWGWGWGRGGEEEGGGGGVGGWGGGGGVWISSEAEEDEIGCGGGERSWGSVWFVWLRMELRNWTDWR